MGPLKATAAPVQLKEANEKNNNQQDGIPVVAGESTTEPRAEDIQQRLEQAHKEPTIHSMFRHPQAPHMFIINGLQPPTQKAERSLSQASLKAVGLGEEIEGLQSKYWDSSCEMDVDIDGHDFDFVPDKNVGEANVEGLVDGPLWHNGRFRVRKNNPTEFVLEVNVGDNDAQNNDLHASIKIKGDKARIYGRVKDKHLPEEGILAQVKGVGTPRKPYTIEFKDQEGKQHSIRWRKED
tara:strand:+ start:91 stop:801 length:711 start_codon:yes stop_codon:yes gene_type:complete